MMQKILILNKDGTLVQPASGGKWVQHPTDQVLLPAVAEALQRYRADGWRTAIATNQGGVAAGHKTEQSAIDEVRFAMVLTNIDYAMLAHSYEDQDVGEAIAIYPEYFDSGPAERWKIVTRKNRRFRKPSPGTIHALAEMVSGQASAPKDCQILFVGDRPEDQQSAANARIDFMWADQWRIHANMP